MSRIKVTKLLLSVQRTIERFECKKCPNHLKETPTPVYVCVFQVLCPKNNEMKFRKFPYAQNEIISFRNIS